MSYDAIVDAEPKTAPSKPAPSTKPGTKPTPTRREDPRKTPFQPGPGPNPKPKAKMEEEKKYIEDIMKMVETHSKAKLSKDGQSREGFHEKMNHLSFQANRNRDETPKASCFSFFASWFYSKTPER